MTIEPGRTLDEGRIPGASLRELGLINWIFTKLAARVIKAPRMHLFTALGQHKRLFRFWYLYGAVLYWGKLPRPETELVILRVAHLRNCEYELQQHRRIAERYRVHADLQAKIFAWPDTDGLSARQQALLRATDEFVTARAVSTATWDTLAAYLSRRQLIEFCMLAAQYDSLATVISILDVPLDFPLDPPMESAS
ncbi:MAG: carboxymuconolactone decarboxylase family protein [Mycobacterium sp.]|nr:carboxymuconolactone decarboxylase family protein [Mycobacterium sp.]